MAGLGPAIHVFVPCTKSVDARHKARHDESNIETRWYWPVLHFLRHDWIFAARGPKARILPVLAVKPVLVQLIDHVGDEELVLGFVRRRRQHFAVCFGPRSRILLPTPCPYR